ncbi:hypothetical protein ABPG74_001594 [Tetrahymena malaccensis]
MFLDIVDQESTLKQKYLDMQINQDNLNSSYSLIEQQFDRQSSSELHFQQLIQNTYAEQSVGQQQSDLQEQQLHQNQRGFQKQNIIKNILKSFLRYLNKLNDASIKQKYQSLYNAQFLISYSEIKKSLSRKINQKTTRWNFKLKSVVQSKNVQPIFYDYLKNQSKIWLQKSKRVSNLIEHELLINELLVQIEKDLPLKIRIYKKKN